MLIDIAEAVLPPDGAVSDSRNIDPHAGSSRAPPALKTAAPAADLLRSLFLPNNIGLSAGRPPDSPEALPFPADAETACGKTETPGFHPS